MGMTSPTPKPRWYRLTPDRLVTGLLVVECLPWLSERFSGPSTEKGLDGADCGGVGRRGIPSHAALVRHCPDIPLAISV